MIKFDMITNIGNTADKYIAECYVTDAKLERLDKMLNEYNIPHCFCIASSDIIERFETSNNKEYITSVMYQGEQETLFSLVFCLWGKIELNVSDEKILKGFHKKAHRKLTDEDVAND